MYAPLLLDHFHHPRNRGDLPGATAKVAASNPVCGDTLELAVLVRDGRVAAARFRAQGCPPAVACSSVLTELLLGKTIDQLREITAAQIAEALGGLPPATRHGSQLAEDAVDLLIDALADTPARPK